MKRQDRMLWIIWAVFCLGTITISMVWYSVGFQAALQAVRCAP